MKETPQRANGTEALQTLHERAKQQAREVLLKNRRSEGTVHYTTPSKESYPYQWLWDSCFHGIALSHLDPEFGKEEMRTLLLRQCDNGLIPHIIYWKAGPLHWYDWGLAGTSSITQPPMLALAIARLFEKTKDTGFLHETIQPLINYYRYLLERRDPLGRGCVGIINPDETGEDNSPRFDTLLDFPPDVDAQTHHARRFELIEAYRASGFDERHMYDLFWIDDVSFNCILLANLEELILLAEKADRPQEVEYFRIRREKLREAMRKHMLHNGRFWSVAPFKNIRLEVATWAHFMPLFAGLYTQEEAERVVQEELRNPETFRAPYGIRTVSKKEPSYRPEGFTDDTSRRFGGDWRGPVWFASQWFIYQGLLRYGFSEDAAWVRETTLQLIEKSGMREHFNPETGKGSGARDFTWGALALDMVDQSES